CTLECSRERFSVVGCLRRSDCAWHSPPACRESDCAPDFVPVSFHLRLFSALPRPWLLLPIPLSPDGFFLNAFVCLPPMPASHHPVDPLRTRHHLPRPGVRPLETSRLSPLPTPARFSSSDCTSASDLLPHSPKFVSRPMPRAPVLPSLLSDTASILAEINPPAPSDSAFENH